MDAQSSLSDFLGKRLVTHRSPEAAVSKGYGSSHLSTYSPTIIWKMQNAEGQNVDLYIPVCKRESFFLCHVDWENCDLIGSHFEIKPEKNSSYQSWCKLPHEVISLDHTIKVSDATSSGWTEFTQSSTILRI